jgi:hypothetical protein
MPRPRRLKSRTCLILQRLFGAIQRFKDAFHIDRPATLFADKCLCIAQTHRFATFWAGHKLIGADGGDANSLRIATPQPRTQLSQRPHEAITPFAGRPGVIADRSTIRFDSREERARGAGERM